jgi:alanine racemase
MFTIAEITKILSPVHAKTVSENAIITELCYDSRKVSHPEQTLFFAIVTEQNNGHRYIAELWKKGVKNFVVSDDIAKFETFTDAHFFQVENVVEALQKIGTAHRLKFNIPVIGITGSNGKTIVKEWLAQMLTPFFHIVKNPNSYNSQIGAPVSVWQMAEEHDLAIFEAGISQMGEMEKLAKVIAPNIGIITNIGEAHSSCFTDIRLKLKEKLKLFIHANTLLYCCDHTIIHEILQEEQYQHLQKISWGQHEKATYKISPVERVLEKSVLQINDRSYIIPFTDRASVENTLHAAVMMLHLKIPPASVQEQLLKLTPVDKRMEMLEGQNSSLLINDTYSLDINSLRIALDFLGLQHQKNRKTLIISDFEQIAPLKKEDYEEINRLIQKASVNKLIAIGEKFLQDAGYFTITEQFFYRNTDEFLTTLPQLTFFNEAILVKGARVYHFERIVEALQLRTHQTILSVNLPAIIHNLNYFRSLIDRKTKVMAMVKALCYGLGDSGLIEELCYHHIDYFAVAYTDEGIQLRKRNIKTPIVVLGAEAHSFEKMIHYHLEPEIYNLHYLKLLDNILAQYPEIESFPVHIKLDTGMHRLGFSPEEIAPLLTLLKQSQRIKVSSVFSHLASSECAEEDVFSHQQIALFQEMSQQLINGLGYPVLRHLLNSSGIVRFPEAQFDMVRLGLGLYGLTPIPEIAHELQQPVLLKTLITQIKHVKAGESIGYNRSCKLDSDRDIAIIPIGYADGYPRSFSNGAGEVIVKGKRAPVVGKISMDMTIIDVTGLDVHIGEEVIVYGDEISLTDAAARAGTIPYELLTSISQRVPRIYVME